MNVGDTTQVSASVTGVTIKANCAAAGSFILYGNAAATAETRVNFLVLN